MEWRCLRNSKSKSLESMTLKKRKQKQLLLGKVHMAMLTAGMILSIADRFKELPGIPDWLSYIWPHVLILAMAVKTGGQYLITHIEIKHLK